MEMIRYDQLKESVYREKLKNGLEVTIVPKQGFRKTYAIFTTKYGSIDNEFVPIGLDRIAHVPDGVAHFLEHKMFEKEEGDVFQKFGRLGASANAFTSFTKTSYLFSCTSNVYENLEVLLDFVQTPYFTDESVEKEKGIIAQEIQMYQDNPDWRLSFGLLANLFPTHPIHIDIAGTKESISEIRPEDLYMCYDTFYHPSNMKLLVVGNIDPEMTMAFIKDNQASKDFIEVPPVRRHFPVETKEAIVKESHLEMDIMRPKTLVGGRYFGQLPDNPWERHKFQLAARYGFDLLFGNTSRHYDEWYQTGLIDDTFYNDFSLERDLCFFEIGGDTPNPQALANHIEALLLNLPSRDLTEERLEVLKKKHLGRLLNAMNSVEFIANHFESQNDGVNIFEYPELIEEITIQDVKAALNRLIDHDALTRVYMTPQA